MTIFTVTHKGKSMFPFVQENDIVYIQELMLGPKIGDVVLFYSVETKELTLHRLIDHHKTKGDWSKSVETTNYNTVIGRLVAIERGNRKYTFPEWIGKVIVFLSKTGIPLILKKFILTALAKAYFWQNERTILGRNRQLQTNDL